jgi:hypothetical protein
MKAKKRLTQTIEKCDTKASWPSGGLGGSRQNPPTSAAPRSSARFAQKL